MTNYDHKNPDFSQPILWHQRDERRARWHYG